ncbi:MAG: hypothetical protein JJE53_02735 [Candidatus Pacebacteria bacterium]|nr:hypothetical protein [Candidatus Paceibacterota bacterium]
MRKVEEQHTVLLKVILNKVIKSRWVANDSVPQVSNFLGNVELTEFLGYNFTVGTHINSNHAHFLMIDKTIKEIKRDISLNKKEIRPQIVFTIKFGKDKIVASFRSGGTTPIILNEMKNHEFFEVFIEFQKILNQFN